jgi:O-antigen/teichoic acid export membrane protein
MKTNLSIITGSSIIFGGTIFQFAFNLAATMIQTRIFTTGDFGKLTLANTIITSLIVVGMFGMPMTIARYTAYFRGAGDWAKIKAMMKTVTRWLFSINVILLVAVCFFGKVYADTVFNERGLGAIVVLLALLYPAKAYVSAVASFFTGLKMMGPATMINSVFQPALKLCVLAVLLVAGISDLMLWVYCLLGIFLAEFLYSAFVFRNRRPPEYISAGNGSIDKNDILGFSVSIFFSAVFIVGIQNIDIIMVGYYEQSSEVGIYKVYKILTVILLFAISAVGTTYNPSVTELYAKRDFDGIGTLYRRVTKWYQFISIFGFIGIILSGQWLGKICFGQNYALSSPLLVIFLAASILVTGVLGPINTTLIAFRRSRLLLANSLLALSIMVIASYILVPAYGKTGAAFATFVCMLILHLAGALEIYFLHRLHPFQKKVLPFLLASLMTIVLLVWLGVMRQSHIGGEAYIAVVCTILLGFAMFVKLSGVIDDEDMKLVRHIYGKAAGWRK